MSSRLALRIVLDYALLQDVGDKNSVKLRRVLTHFKHAASIWSSVFGQYSVKFDLIPGWSAVLSAAVPCASLFVFKQCHPY